MAKFYKVTIDILVDIEPLMKLNHIKDISPEEAEAMVSDAVAETMRENMRAFNPKAEFVDWNIADGPTATDAKEFSFDYYKNGREAFGLD